MWGVILSHEAGKEGEAGVISFINASGRHLAVVVLSFSPIVFVHIQLLLPSVVVVVIVVACCFLISSCFFCRFSWPWGRYECCRKCIFKCNEIITQLVKVFCGQGNKGRSAP